METFQAFVSNKQKGSKYFPSHKKNQALSQNHVNGSVFILPKQFLERTLYTINDNPEIQDKPKVRIASNNSFTSDYEANLRKTAYSHSKEMIEKKSLKKIQQEYTKNKIAKNYSYPEIDNESKMRKNNRDQNSNRTKMANRTWNILYNTIVDSKGHRKKNTELSISTKRLPIIDKLSETSRQKGLEKLKELSEKYLPTEQAANQMQRCNHQLSRDLIVLQKSQRFRPTRGRQIFMKKNVLPSIMKQGEIQPWSNLQNQQQLPY